MQLPRLESHAHVGGAAVVCGCVVAGQVLEALQVVRPDAERSGPGRAAGEVVAGGS